MFTDKYLPRLTGAAFLFVIIASLSSGLLFPTGGGSGSSISEIMLDVSKNVTMAQGSVLLGIINCTGVIVLAMLLFSVLSNHNRVMARFALGLWLAEAIVLTLSSAGAFALVALSQGYVQAGAPQGSFYQTLGEFLYNGLYKFGSGTLHMWFYCLGGIIWYGLFYESHYIPRIISLYGILAVLVGLVGIVFQFFGYTVPIFVYLPLLPFELTIGLWLLIKGIGESSKTLRAGKPKVQAL
jgi:hypothetical protein